MEKEIAGELTSRVITSTLVNIGSMLTSGYGSSLLLFPCLLLRCIIHEIHIYKHAQVSEMSPDARK